MSIVNYQGNTGTNVVSKIKTLNGDTVNPGDIMALYKDTAIKNIDTTQTYTSSLCNRAGTVVNDIIDVSPTHYAVITRGGYGSTSSNGAISIFSKADNSQTCKITFNDIKDIVGFKMQDSKILIVSVRKDTDGSGSPTYSNTVDFYVYNVSIYGILSMEVYTSKLGYMSLYNNYIQDMRIIKFKDNVFILAIASGYTNYYLYFGGIVYSTGTLTIGSTHGISVGTSQVNKLSMCIHSLVNNTFACCYNAGSNCKVSIYSINTTSGNVTNPSYTDWTMSGNNGLGSITYVTDNLLVLTFNGNIYTFGLYANAIAPGTSLPCTVGIILIAISNALILAISTTQAYTVNINSYTSMSANTKVNFLTAPKYNAICKKSATEFFIVNSANKFTLVTVSGVDVIISDDCGIDISGLANNGSDTFTNGNGDFRGNLYHDGTNVYVSDFSINTSLVCDVTKVQKIVQYPGNLYLGRALQKIYGISKGAASAGSIVSVLVEGSADMYNNLIPSKTYYCGASGTPATSNPLTDNTVKIGFAIDTKSILITNSYRQYV